MQLVLHPLDEGNTSEASVTLPVESGRLDGELRFDDVPTGRYRLSMHLGPAGNLTYVGAVTSFEILPVATALETRGQAPGIRSPSQLPQPLQQPHPALLLPAGGPAVGGAGRVRPAGPEAGGSWCRGRGSRGLHAVEWDGRDDGGRPLASGSYLCRLRAGPYQGVGKLLLLR